MSFVNINFQSGTYSTGAVTVNDTVNYVEVCAIAPLTKMQGSPITGDWYIAGTVGAGGALTGLKLTAAPDVNGTHTDILVDADFSSSNALLVAATANAHVTVAGGKFYIILRNMRSLPEVKLWAKGAATTLQLQGSIR